MKIIKYVLNDRIAYFNEKMEPHRDDDPAIEYNDGGKIWFQNGLHHRLNGPAVEYASGDKRWYQNGELHREDGPAIECDDGHKEWWQNGKRHRLDGPAILYPSGEHWWFFNGRSNRFNSEYLLKQTLQENQDIKQEINDLVSANLDPGETFLLRLTIANHFPQYLDFLDKLLILK